MTVTAEMMSGTELAAAIVDDCRRRSEEIARRRGLRRQSVQRVADNLEERGLIGYRENPNHARWKLAYVSAKGKKISARTSALAQQSVGRAARGLSRRDVRTDAGRSEIQHLHGVLGIA